MMAGHIGFGDLNSGFQANNVHGPVNVAFQRPYEPPETSPSPTIIIPFGRDKNFIKRDGLFDQVLQLSAVPGSRVALAGFGGAGKSQIAIEYAYLIRESSPETWVFWVHASDANQYEQDIRRIADYVKVPGRHEPKQNMFQLFENWLRGDQSGKWVIILDNLDDAAFLLSRERGDSQRPQELTRGEGSGTSAPLVSHLPRCEKGSVLITTRSRYTALQLVEPCDMITIGPMSPKEAQELVESKLGDTHRSENGAEAEALACALECIPLAILQATSYITQRGSRISIPEYLEKLQKSDRKKASVLDYEGGKLRRDLEAKNSVILTWQISFDHIRTIRVSAADMLSLMSFCNRQGIPDDLLLGQSEVVDPEDHWCSEGSDESASAGTDEGVNSVISDTDDEESSGESANDSVEKDIMVLRDYCFISADQDGKTLSMHALVQLSVRRWLHSQGQQRKWKGELIRRLSAKIQPATFANLKKDWEKFRVYLPHARAALEYKPKDKRTLATWATVMYKAGANFGDPDSTGEARRFSEGAMEAFIQLHGRRHRDSLEAMSLVALVYRMDEQHLEAEKLDMEVAETRKMILGPDHDDSLTALISLSLTYLAQHRYAEGKELIRSVAETLKSKVSTKETKGNKSHYLMLSAMDNLAWTCFASGQYGEAQELCAEVLKIREEQLGNDHLNTAASRSLMCLLLIQDGRSDEAEEMALAVLQTQEQKLGLEHGETMSSRRRVARVYQDQGYLEKAQILYKANLDIYNRRCGPRDSRTLTTLHEMALLHFDQGQFQEAEQLQKQVWDAHKENSGVNHQNTLSAMLTLASMYKRHGRLHEAERLVTEAVKIGSANLGSHHPLVSAGKLNLGLNLQKQKRWEAAEKLFLDFLNGCEKELEADHRDVLGCRMGLAVSYIHQGRHNEAKRIWTEALNMTLNNTGVYPRTTTTLAGYLTEALRVEKRWGELETALLSVLEAQEQTLGVDHNDTLESMITLARLYTDQKRFEEALKVREKLTQVSRAKLGLNDGKMLVRLNDLGVLYVHLRRLEDAREVLEEAVAAVRIKYGDDSSETMRYFTNLVRVYVGQGPYWIAEGLTAKSKMQAEAMLAKPGITHQKTLRCLGILERCCHGRQQLEELEKLQVKILDSRKDEYGADHPDTLDIMMELAKTYDSRGRREEAEKLHKEVTDLRASSTSSG